MSEQAMRQNVVKLLKQAALDPVAVENPCCPGTPDVNYVDGWIELKQLDDWPTREDTPVRVSHFTQVQRIWLKRRILKGGRAFVLLQVRQHWLLLDGLMAAKILGRATQAELRAAALATWQGLSQVREELPRCLSRQET